VLKVENVTKYYGDNIAVDNLSFEVKPGEVFGLLGVNGAGKTTTFRMIIGLLDKTKGKITLNDERIDYSVTDNIGFLTEERSLLTKLTVKEQAVYYGVLKGLTKEAALEKLDVLLERFNIVSYKDREIKELSKGNQQKVQFLCAIINDPKLLILDEPFSGLDPINVELFMDVIKELSSKGTMIIFSSHRMEHVELFCEKLIVLLKGKPVISGALSDIKKEYRRKNIFLQADTKISDLKEISGVVSVKKQAETFVISIEDENKVENVFKYVSKLKNVVKFSVEEPSLNEIFVSKVGEAYEK